MRQSERATYANLPGGTRHAGASRLIRRALPDYLEQGPTPTLAFSSALLPRLIGDVTIGIRHLLPSTGKPPCRQSDERSPLQFPWGDRPFEAVQQHDARRPAAVGIP